MIERVKYRTDHVHGLGWENKSKKVIFFSLSESIQTMFWALFDQVDQEEFETKNEKLAITQRTGKILFALYSVCAVVVALNMLIAMMSNSFDNISVRCKFNNKLQWLSSTK